MIRRNKGRSHLFTHLKFIMSILLTRHCARRWEHGEGVTHERLLGSKTGRTHAQGTAFSLVGTAGREDVLKCWNWTCGREHRVTSWRWNGIFEHGDEYPGAAFESVRIWWEPVLFAHYSLVHSFDKSLKCQVQCKGFRDMTWITQSLCLPRA